MGSFLFRKVDVKVFRISGGTALRIVELCLTSICHPGREYEYGPVHRVDMFNLMGKRSETKQVLGPNYHPLDSADRTY